MVSDAVRTLNVNERFGLTVQGEGPSMGTPCAFVRLSNCPLTCSWCDTGQTWAYTDAKAAKHQSGKKYDKAEEIHPQSVDEIAAWLLSLPWAKGRQPLVVISGGDPMLQQEAIFELIMHPTLMSAHFTWEIETAGTIPTTAKIASLADSGHLRFNVSPKLASSGNTLLARRKSLVLQELVTFRDTAWKFVVTCAQDLAEIDELVDLSGAMPQHVYLMPEGTSSEKVIYGMQGIVELAIERGYNLTTRMHTLIWGDERGR